MKITLASLDALVQAQQAALDTLTTGSVAAITALSEALAVRDETIAALSARVEALETRKPGTRVPQVVAGTSDTAATTAVQELPRLTGDAQGRARCESVDGEGKTHGSVSLRPDGRCPRCFTQAVQAACMAKWARPTAEAPAESVAA